MLFNLLQSSQVIAHADVEHPAAHWAPHKGRVKLVAPRLVGCYNRLFLLEASDVFSANVD